MMKELYTSLPRCTEAITHTKGSHMKYQQSTVTSLNEHYVIYFHFSASNRSILISLCEVAENLCTSISGGSLASSSLIQKLYKKI